jgi:hypothetical protein
MVEFDKIDELHEHNEGEQCYAILKKHYDSDASAKQNVDILWRLGRACHLLASSLPQKNPKKRELLTEGQKYAQAAYKIDQNNFHVLKWCAVLTGTLTDYLGTKEKIQQGYQFKEYLDKALAMHTEYSLLHMRGRFSYSVATLSWFERKAASAFFATPPTATIDDALKDFLEVEKVRPNVWIENLLFVARCYINKGDKANTVKYLKQASLIEAQDDADTEALEEVKQLLAKHAK